MDLMDFCLLGEGYHLYVDNFYSSSAVFHKLSAHNIMACGTIQPNCVGFPKTTVNELPKKAERGDEVDMKRQPSLYQMERYQVGNCISFYQAFTGHTTCRRVKEARQWQVKKFPILDPVRDYDRSTPPMYFSNAHVQFYPVHGKTMRRHFCTISLTSPL